MRNYASISPMFWVKGSGKKLRGHKEAQLVALYLMSAPATNMVGIFPLSLPTLCHETGLSEAEARLGLEKCQSEDIEIAFWDEADELVWVPSLAEHQVGEELKLSRDGKPDNKIHGVARALAPFKGHRFYDLFVARYRSAYKLDLVLGAPSKPLPSPFQAPSKPLPSPFQAPSKSAEAPSKPLPRGYDPDPDPVLDPDLQNRSDQPVRSGTERTAARTTREPSNLAEALTVPIAERAVFAKERPDLRMWIRPQEWPELLEVWAILQKSSGERPRKLSEYDRDSGVRALVGLFSDGFTLDNLRAVARSLPATDWWKAADSRGLASLTPEVVRRELARLDRVRPAQRAQPSLRPALVGTPPPPGLIDDFARKHGPRRQQPATQACGAADELGVDPRSETQRVAPVAREAS